MFRSLAVIVASAAALAASSVSAATIVNLPSVDFGTGGAPAPTTLTLAPGTYTATVIAGVYSGWDAATTTFPVYPTISPTPAPGYYTEEYDITNGGVTTDVYGLHGAGSTPAGNVGPKYDTIAQALAAAQANPFTFTVTAAAPTVSFVIPDNLYADNTGGVSLSIAAVPEASTWAMMIVGMGMMGFAMRRRRAVATNVSYAA